ncbi:MAG: PEP-CTERM sorting domain-containing protein [Alteromonadales bacterium]|nr:PEP-CTERM sorting domain-containing protein [Alteromonadales bacterium]
MKHKNLYALITGIILYGTSLLNFAHAGLVMSAGQLIGATDITVSGSSYDVEFIDGTCVKIFDGCDSQDDFTFTSQTAATLAAQALIDQVFGDGALTPSVDAAPEVTRGCEHYYHCGMVTPYELPLTNQGLGMTAYNVINARVDYVHYSYFGIHYNLSNHVVYTFARWTAVMDVPEPFTLAIFALGIMGLASRRLSRQS